MKYPGYLNLEEKELELRIEKANQMLESCHVCPRKCGANRAKNEKGFCCLGKKARVFSSAPHFGEEKCLVGQNGSGTIFFNYCNLSCVYCQNYDISQLERGKGAATKEVTDKELANLMLSLQRIGCHNINLVSPTSQVPAILASLPIAIEGGLEVPLVYNTNAYDSVETLELLDGIIDIYLPDFKYSDDILAIKYSQSPNYFEIAKKSIKEMHRQVGDLEIDQQGLAKKGLIVRHLILPAGLAGSEKILKFLAKEVSKDTCINIMSQYNPCWQANKYPELNRLITMEEYNEVIDLAKKYKLKILTE
ncbi:radical SAM protein [Patescibacteria group bacterium]|nr:radical SAM protein [Patescibacteria group bacterium]